MRASETDGGGARGARVERRKRDRDGATRGTTATSERGNRVAAAGDRVPVGPPHL